ncbi:SPOR domain-containing protein [bacterium]|nr:SPOR domain-containing protein [bacterium]
MDDIEDQKRRLLTPPAEWLDRVKAKSPDEKSGFESQQENADGGDKLSTSSVASGQRKNLKTVRLTAIISSVLFIGMTSLWLETRSNGKARINALEEKITLLERTATEDSMRKNKLTAQNASLRSQVILLETNLKSISNENTSLKETQVRQQEGPVANIKVAKAPANSGTSLIPPPSQAGGMWFVNLESHTSSIVAQDRATELRAQLKPLNISVKSAVVRSRQYFRVRAMGFKSETLAKKAADWMSLQAKAGPYWIGKNPDKTQESGPNLKATARAAEVAISKPDTLLNLQELGVKGSWFIFVDTFDQRSLAEAAIEDLNDQGLEAKVTVEAKSGAIFYRVQIPGIESEAEGDAIMKQLKRSEFMNAKLRKTVG